MGDLFYRLENKLADILSEEYHALKSNFFGVIAGGITAAIITAYPLFFISDKIHEFKKELSIAKKCEIEFLEPEEDSYRKINLGFLELSSDPSAKLSKKNFPSKFEVLVYKDDEYIISKFARDKENRTIYWEDCNGKRHYNAGFHQKLH